MLRSLLLCLVLAVSLPACGGASSEQVAAQLSVDDFSYARLPDGTRIVTGTLHNGSTRHLDNVQLRVALYDAQNRRVSSVNILVRDVASGGDKAFREAVDTDVQAQGARIQSVTIL